MHRDQGHRRNQAASVTKPVTERERVSADPDWYETAGISLGVHVTDITQQDVYAALRAEHFPERPHPAESFVEVSSLADPAWMIEIEAIGLIHQG
ncbi:RidA family protein [Streptomyces sp. NBC_01017]|uniref:RidA family protein n=1 Tax=Streptomyces machairae TaxID=3134109 RepID=A0ABU8UUN4_9ACTN|nr:RidA family protein [Streptomyces sp. NBC_01017]